MLLNRHRRHPIANNGFFMVFEAAVVIATSVFFFIALLDLILPACVIGYSVELSVLFSLLLVAIKDMHQRLRNLVTMVSSIGVGLFMGLYVGFEMAMIVLSVIAVYDYIAVFVTKSMLKLAGVIDDENMALVISSSHIDIVPESNYSKKEVAEYLRDLHDDNEDGNPVFKRILDMGELPVISQVQLGEGDIGLPLMAIVAAYFTFNNFFISYIILAGSLLGLFAATYTLQRYRRPLPAIPPIFFFIYLSALIALIAFGQILPELTLMTFTGGVAFFAFVLSLTFVMKHNKD
jgi:presenilin-like A22 family membrane protease